METMTKIGILFRTVSATEAVIVGEPSGDGEYDAKNWVEKIDIRGVLAEPKEISVRLNHF